MENMEIAIKAILILLEIILIYFLKNKILDLISRILQGIIAPLDFVVRKLEKTYTSIARLNYRQRVLNFLLVFISLVMLVSEFGTLREILNTTATSDTIGIAGVQVTVGTFAAVAYMTISIVLGFMSLELFNIRDFFQGVFFNDPPRDDSSGTDKTRARKWMAISFFVILIFLAILQGILSIQRFQLSSRDEVVPRLAVRFALPFFYFILGFLTPIMAAFALLSFDVVGALLAKFVVSIIQFIQKMIAVVFMALEVLIQFLASPLEKLLELFGIYQERNINERNKDKVAPAVRIAPIENSSPIYLENLSTMYRLFTSFRRHDDSLMFLSDIFAVNFLVPSHEFKINENTVFTEVAKYIKETYKNFEGRLIQFKYIDSEGRLRNIPLKDNVINYMKLTDTIVIDAYFESEESSQGTTP